VNSDRVAHEIDRISQIFADIAQTSDSDRSILVRVALILAGIAQRVARIAPGLS
jgi:hypothetical protein